MRSRGLRWLVLAFTCLWFGVLLPVHQRGRITLPGACAEAAAASLAPQHACCPTTGGEHKPADAPPAGPDSRACAVCYYIATLDLPPTMGLEIAPPRPLELRDATDPPALVAARTPLPYDPTGPPTA
jgi:hypothetical protein